MNINSLKSISQNLQTTTNINDALAEQHKILTQFGHIFIVNTDGNISNISPYKFSQNTVNVGDSDYVKFVSSTKKPFISKPEDGFFGYKAIVIAIPIFLDVGSNNLRFSGTICATIRIETIFGAINKTQLGAHGFAAVIDADGVFLDHPQKDFVLNRKIDERVIDGSAAEFNQLLSKQDQGISQYSDRGNDFILGFSKIGEYGWTVLVSLSRNDVLTDATSLKITSILVATLFILVTALLTLFFQIRTERLQRIVDEKTGKIADILKTIRQGIMTFSENLIIDSEYSAYSRKLYGNAGENIAGQRVIDLVFRGSNIKDDEIQKTTETLRTSFWKSLSVWETDAKVLPTEVEITLQNEKKFISMTWTPMIRNGVVDRVMLSVTDLTATRNMEAALSQSAKLSALGEMAAGVAHEINNPLAVISMRSQQVQRIFGQPNSEENIRNFLANIQASCVRITKIVSGMRIFARDSTDDPFSEASITSILEDVYELAMERLKYGGITYIVGDIPQSLIIECRAGQLAQVLINLINNAYDAIKESSRDKWIRVDGVDLGTRIEISVTDSGDGIPKEIVDKLMQPFFTTKPIGQGTGLGLSISLGIIKNHGGQLTVDSKCPNTRFVVNLPKEH